jgi:hypothetical protein
VSGPGCKQHASAAAPWEGSILHDLMTCAHGSGEGIQLPSKVASHGVAVRAHCGSNAREAKNLQGAGVALW